MVSDQTLDTDIWTDIRTVLVAASLATTEGTSVTSASVRAAYNDEPSIRPQVIINPISVDERKDKFGADYGKRFINVDIECYAKSSLATDQLMQQVNYALSTTTIDGIDLVGVSTDYAFNTVADSKVHLKTGTFTYDRE